MISLHSLCCKMHYYVVPCCVVLCCNVLHCVGLSCKMLQFTVLCCVVQCYTVLKCNVLNCVALCCVVLWCILLCSTIFLLVCIVFTYFTFTSFLYCDVPCCNMFALLQIICQGIETIFKPHLKNYSTEWPYPLCSVSLFDYSQFRATPISFLTCVNWLAISLLITLQNQLCITNGHDQDSLDWKIGAFDVKTVNISSNLHHVKMV